MGNVVSSGLSGGITREQLLASTRDNREFTNKIFGAMISKLTPADILELSDSNKCSKYIFLMAQSFDKMFDDLRIRPIKDSKTGLVYYKKVDDLVNPKGAGATQKLLLCREIAYFNIRLFQIFGALALSIIDDNAAGAVLGSYSEAMKRDMYTLEQKDPAAGRDFWGQAKARPGSKPVMIGGAVDDSAFPSRWPEFKNLKNILDPAGSITMDGVTKSDTLIFSGSELYLYFESKDGLNTPYLYFNKDNNSYYCKIQLQTQSSRPPFRRDFYRNEPRYDMDIEEPKIRVTLNSFYYYNNILSETAYRRINKVLSAASKSFDIQSSDNKSSWYTILERQDFVVALKQNLVETIKSIVKRDEDGKALFGSEAERVRYDGPGYGPPGAPGRAFSESGSSDDILRTKYIIDTIQGISKGDRISFCAARALQLIDARSTFIPRPTVVTSSVCKSRLESLPTSVPSSKLTEVPGLKSLEQLYYKPTTSAAGKTVYSPDETSPAKYADFLIELKAAFNPSGPANPKTLDGIGVKNPAECVRDAANKYLYITDPKKIREIIGYANSLFSIQLTHTKKVIDFFKSKLFSIKKSNKGTTIDIHPSLLTGDFNELEKVSKDARKLLVEYYSGCEKKYQEGLKAVLTESSTYKLTPEGRPLGK